jgi:predicted RND superfamily exporter protein
LASSSSALEFMPGLKQQRDNLHRLTEERPEISKTRLSSAFEAAVSDSGLKMTPVFTRYIQLIAGALDERTTIDLRSLMQRRGMERILERFIEPADDGGIHVAVHVAPSDFLSKKQETSDFARMLKHRVGEETNISSTAQLATALKDVVTLDMRIVGLLAIGSVLTVLLIQFRRLKISIAAIVPLLSSSIITLAICNLIGIDLNPINLFVVPMILGIGIDDGIHLVHRWIESKNVHEALSSTGKALILTSLTTILAFGTLIFAGHQGLTQIGFFTIIGVGIALLASMTFLPALLVHFSLDRRMRQ